MELLGVVVPKTCLYKAFQVQENTGMSVKEQTLSWLADLPESSAVWADLHEEVRLLHAIVEAEQDVRERRTSCPEEVTQKMEAKWALRSSKSS